MNGGNLYQLWRDVLPQLALNADIGDDEVSVFKPMIPNIDDLVGHPVVDPIELDPKSSQLRLHAILAVAFSRMPYPTLLLLEDIHWADEESQAMIGHLVSMIGKLPVMMIASSRETTLPAPYEKLPDLAVLRLNRLQQRDTAELGQFMLGAMGHRPEIVDLLTECSEGNPHFFVQAARVIAETPEGDLPAILERDDLRRRLSGGIMQLVQQQFKALDLPVKQLLQAAAIQGRDLDLGVLKAMFPHPDLEATLSDYANTVFHVAEGKWRFAHELFRESLLAELSEAERRNLHRQVATTIIRIHGEQPDQVAVLAHHWSEAFSPEERDLNTVQKTMQYLERAGMQALSQCANREAIRFFSRLLAFNLHTNPAFGAQERSAYWHCYLGQAYLGTGQLEDSTAHLQRGLQLLIGLSSRRHRGLLLARTLAQIARYLVASAGSISLAQPRRNRIAYQDAARACAALQDVSIFSGDLLLTANLMFRSYHLAHRAGASPELAWAEAMLALVMGLVGWHSRAEHHFALAQAQSLHLRNTVVNARILNAHGTYHMNLGQCLPAVIKFSEAAAISRQVGNWRGWEEATAGQIGVALFQARYREALTHARELTEVAQQAHDVQARIWGIDGQAIALMRLGDLDSAFAFTQESTALMSKNQDRVETVSHLGIYALVAFQRGDWSLAQDLVLRTLELLPSWPTLWSVVVPAANVAQISFACWGRYRDAESHQALFWKQKASQAISLLRRYARVLPTARVYLKYGKGLWHWLEGRFQQAFDSWRASFMHAQNMNLPYEQGLACYEIACHLENQTDLRMKFLAESYAYFTQIEATFEKRRIEDMLN